MVRNPRIRKKRAFYISVVMSMLLLSSLGVFSGVLSDNTCISREDQSGNVLKTSETFTDTLIIDDVGGGDMTWSQAKNTYGYCTGTGTEEDPYIFENHDFLLPNGGGSCLIIRNSSNYFIIRNCEFSHSGIDNNADNGITLEYVENGQILNNDCSFNFIGINFQIGFSSNDISISNNLLNNNTFVGIYMESCSDNTISGNTANYNGQYGLKLLDTDKTTISGNNLNLNLESGIYFKSSTKNIIVENSVSQNRLDGIYFDSSDQNIVIKNIMNTNEEYGFYLTSSNYNSISSNTINNNKEGMHTNAVNNNFIYSNSINYNGDYGIYLEGGTNNMIIGNYIIGTLNTIDGTSGSLDSNIIKENIYTSSASGIPGYDLLILFSVFFVSVGIITIILNKRRLKS